jgi:hypothetical protein
MPRPGSALVALAAFAVYAFLCPPVSGMGDASEFTLVLATGGVAHPTGYPLYTLFGHFFCVLLHALGISWPRAASLWSAVGGAVAIYFLHALGTELAGVVPGAGGAPRVGATGRFLAALVPVSLFAFQPIVLGEATHAEINTWSLAWACGAAYLFVRLVGAAGAADREQVRHARRGATLWGLVCGLGLAHHLTSVLISAPLSAGLIAVLARRRWFRPSLMLIGAGAALVPVASYGIVAWHAWHPAGVQWGWLEPSLASVVTHVSGGQYRQFVGYFAPTPLQQELLAAAAYPFLIPGLALLMLGVLRAKDAERRIEASALFAAAALVTIFTFSYGVPDPAPYFLPAMALGVAAAAPALAAIPGVGSRAGGAALGSAGLAGLVLIVPWLREGVEVRAATLLFEKTIHSMWSAIPPDTAIVSWADDRFNHLREYQVLRGEKPALLVVTPDLLFTNSMRRTIRQRFGVDPVEGFRRPRLSPGRHRPEDDAIIDRSRQRLVRDLNDRIRPPVILFDPKVPIVFQLRKPWESRRGPAEQPARTAPR